MPVAWRLVPHAVGMEQSPSIRGEGIAREERHGRIGDVQAPIEQPMSALWRPVPDHEGHPEPPPRGKGAPHPRIARGGIIEPSQRSLGLLGMHKAPELVQLACNDMEVAPQGKQHQSAGLGRAIQPWTHGICVNVDDACRRTDRLAFGSGPPRHLKPGGGGRQLQGRCPRADRHRRFASLAPRLFLAVTTAMLDQEARQERTPIIPATPVRTVEGLPVHGALLEKGALFHRACNN